MSQQYPPPPPGWPQYANNHYYPDYSASAPAITSSPASTQPNIQHPNIPPSISAQNQQRYESNAQIPLAPNPFPFPHNFDPTIFKQFGGAHIPQPPPPNFAPIPLPTVNTTNLVQYPHAAGFPLPSVENNYHPAGVAASPFRTTPMHSTQNVPLQNSHVEAGVVTAALNQSLNDHRPLQFPQSIGKFQPPPLPAVSGEGANSFRHNLRQPVNKDESSPSSQLQAEVAKDSHPTVSPLVPNYAETRERAKAAVLSLTASGISFQDLSGEGINPNLLGQLFDELGLEKSVKNEATQTGNKHETAKQSSVIEKLASASSAEASAQLVLSPGMERKDRIARLLAARKVQGTGNEQASKSASPATASIPESSQPASGVAEERPQLNTVTSLLPTTAADNHTLSKIAAAVNAGQHSRADLEALHKSLPSPLQIQLEQSGIPGLFMTSADFPDERSTIGSLHAPQLEAEAEQLPDAQENSHKIMKSTTEVIQNLDNPRKRAAAAFDDAMFHPSKRASLESQEAADVEMEWSKSEDDATEEFEEGEYEPEDTRTTNGNPKPRRNDQIEELSSSLAQGRESTMQPTNSSTFQAYNRDVVENNQHNTERQLKVTSTSFAPSPVSPKINQISQASWSTSTQQEKTVPEGDPSVDTLPSSKGPKVDQGKLAARMAALKADLVAKNTRKRALQEGMPVLDAEVEKTRAKLEQIRRDLTKTQMTIETKTAELEQAKSFERDLLQEIKQLEQQFADGLSGQRQFSSELVHLNDQIKANEKNSAVPEARNPITPGLSILNNNDTGFGVYSSNPEAGKISSNPSDDSTQQASGPHAYNPSPIFDQPEQSEPAETVTTTTQGHDRREHSMHDISTANQYDDLTHETSVVSSAATEITAESGDEQMSIDNEEEEEEEGDEYDEDGDGSVSMSDSGSENYEPAETGDGGLVSLGSDESEGYEPNDAHMAKEDIVVDPNDADDYEPSEEVDALDPISLESMQEENNNSAPASIAQTDAKTNGVEVITSTDAQERTTQISAPSEPVGEDDREQGLSLTEANMLIKTQDAELPSSVPLGEEKDPSTSRFVPYRSPLTPLKSFRFHPQFNDLVKSGYRSLTYSNQIDAKRPLCPTELTGEVCTDASCEEQHFGSMALSDDKILVQMSSANDLKDKAQRDAYLIGLKKVIADLRERGVKEFSEVADALSKYRREWMEAQLASTS